MAASRPSDPDRKLKYMQAFRFLGPPTYAGNPDFLEAEDWLRGVTKCMDAIDVPADLRVPLATFMLTGDADRWWEVTQRGHDVRSMTWKDFEGRFRKMYFPNYFQCRPVNREFLDLTQGDLTVSQYVAKFIRLSWYLVALVDKEDNKISMFKRGLKPSIIMEMEMFTSKGSTFEDVVNQALAVESMEDSSRKSVEISNSEASGSGGKSVRTMNSSHNNRYRPYKCYKCRKPGHIQRNCPDNQSPSSDYKGGY